jgi:uncharacterized protein YndB with AHSA1/START domain
MSASVVAETSELVIERVFDAPRERVWEVFTKPEHIQKWWGPIPFTAPVIELDLRAGGAFRFAMRSPDGHDYWNAGTVREVTPPEKLVIDMYFANEKGEQVSPSTYGFPEGSPSLQVTTFLFRAEGPRTRLTVRQGPIPTGMGANAKLGWESSLEKAARAVADHVAENTPTKELVVERVYDAPRERVFEVFTKGEHIQKWWGPKGVGNAIAEFDARPGGAMFMAERLPSGPLFYIAGSVLEIERPSRIVFAFHYANEKRERITPPDRSGLPATWADEIVTTVMLAAEGSRTRVTITTRVTDEMAVWAGRAREGWAQTLDKIGYAVADDMKVAPAGDLEIVITRTFNAPRALVYQALTKAEHVKNWWGPRHYGPVTATADFRAGGHYRFAQGSPQGEVAFSGEIRESSPERIVYVEEFEQMPGHGALTTVTLVERGGKTFMALRSVYQSATDRDAVLASGMEWGARLSYLQLDEVIDSLGKAA